MRSGLFATDCSIFKVTMNCGIFSSCPDSCVTCSSFSTWLTFSCKRVKYVKISSPGLSFDEKNLSKASLNQKRCDIFKQMTNVIHIRLFQNVCAKEHFFGILFLDGLDHPFPNPLSLWPKVWGFEFINVEAIKFFFGVCRLCFEVCDAQNSGQFIG